MSSFICSMRGSAMSTKAMKYSIIFVIIIYTVTDTPVRLRLWCDLYFIDLYITF